MNAAILKKSVNSNPLTLTVLLLLITVLITGCSPADKKAETESATLLPEARQIGNFNLIQHGEGEFNGKFNKESIKDNWSMFFFGYTRCPDICPTALYMMSTMMRQIENNPSSVKQIPKIVFVSVDPQQDKPEALQEFVSFFHPSIIGTTGEQSVVDKLVREVGAIYQRVYYSNEEVVVFDNKESIPEELKNAYLIDHSAAIYLFNPDGDLHAIFPMPHEPDVMIRDLASIQQAWH
ncbi:SCO family protein [Cardiobacterium sp. AH-315-I02]|nr:SCO family protein [Cardiobacterium sp. AH-315-I02]